MAKQRHLKECWLSSSHKTRWNHKDRYGLCGLCKTNLRSC